MITRDKCDWPKPPGCHCNTIAEARGCYERCDDAVQGYAVEPGITREELITIWALSLAIAIVLVACFLFL